MIESMLQTLLTTTTAITNVVASRIHIETDPIASPRPKITYIRTGSDRLYCDDGATMTTARMNVDCWADSATAALQLADTVQNAVEWYSSTTIGRITIRDRRSVATPIVDGKQKPYFREQLVIQIIASDN